MVAAVADPLNPTNNRGKSNKTIATLQDHVHIEVTHARGVHQPRARASWRVDGAAG